MLNQEEFEDTKGVIRICNSKKDRQNMQTISHSRIKILSKTNKDANICLFSFYL